MIPKYKKLKAIIDIEPKNVLELNERYLANIEYKKLAEQNFDKVCDILGEFMYNWDAMGNANDYSNIAAKANEILNHINFEKTN